MSKLWGLVRWSLLRNRSYLPLFIILQTLFGVAMVYGVSLISGTKDLTHQAFIASGSAVLGVITMTCVLAPQMISETKHNGVFDYQRTLPVKRGLILLADLIVWGLAIVPGLIASIVFGVYRFRLEINIDIKNFCLLIFSLLTLILFGFALAYSLKPNILSLVTQLILIAGMMFSPILYPADRLPVFLVKIYDYLPFVPVARVIRASLYSIGQVQVRDVLILTMWLVLSLALSLKALKKRS